MSLADQIKARPENAGSKAPESPKKGINLEVSQDEIEAMDQQLDADIKVDADLDDIKVEPELTPEQLIARTNESYEDEIKKLREEDAKKRIKIKKAEEKAFKMAEEVFGSEREEHKNQLAEMQKQLEELKNLKNEENKVDKKVEQAQSNAEMDALRSQMSLLKEESDKIKAESKARLEAEEQEKSLRKQAAENRFQSLLSEIPEEYKDYASAMFKGHTDPSEGLISITKAKAQGIFGKKTIEVVSHIPGNQIDNNKILSPREKRERKVKLLGERRKGLTPGQTL